MNWNSDDDDDDQCRLKAFNNRQIFFDALKLYIVSASAINTQDICFDFNDASEKRQWENNYVNTWLTFTYIHHNLQITRLFIQVRLLVLHDGIMLD